MSRGITTTFTSTHDIDLHGCGESIAAATDNNPAENLKPFAYCRHVCGACTPVPFAVSFGGRSAGPWFETAKSVVDANEEILTEKSFFRCVTGANAKVEFVDPGQDSITMSALYNCNDFITEQAEKNKESLEEDGHEFATSLLLNGNYGNILTGQGANLDLDDAEARNDGEDHVVIQSIYDPVVSHKETIVDEYSIVVDLPPGDTPQELLELMAGDLDGVIPEVREHGDFRNQDDETSPGVISEIDINEGPLPLPDFIDESLINAPVIMTQYDPDSHFIFQTIEHNNNEHPLHGSREFGFEIQDNGRVRIYTRAVAAPDISGAEIGGLKPERDMWSDFITGVGNYVDDNGGQSYGQTIYQNWGPTGNQLWDLLPREEQIAIKESQINGLQREIDRLQEWYDRINWFDFYGEKPLIEARIESFKEELEAWEEKEITGEEVGDLLLVVSGATLTCPKAVMGSDIKFFNMKK